MQHVKNLLYELNDIKIHSLYTLSEIITNISLKYTAKTKFNYFIIFLIIFNSVNAEANHIDNMNGPNDLETTYLDVTHMLFNQYNNESKIADDHVVDQICNGVDICGIFNSLNGIKLEFCDKRLSEVLWTYIWDHNHTKSIDTAEKCKKLHYQIEWMDSSQNEKFLLLDEFVTRYLSSKEECNSVITRLIEDDNNASEQYETFKTFVKMHQSFQISSERIKEINQDNLNQCLKSYKDWLCSEFFSTFVLLEARNSKERNKRRYIKLPKCIGKCIEVETHCPYFQPFVQNGGEPVFLCDYSHYQSGTLEILKKTQPCMTENHCCKNQIYESSSAKLSQKRTKSPKSQSNRLIFRFYAITIYLIFIYYLERI